jgi:hypothetical protein
MITVSMVKAIGQIKGKTVSYLLILQIRPEFKADFFMNHLWQNHHH